MEALEIQKFQEAGYWPSNHQTKPMVTSTTIWQRHQKNWSPHQNQQLPIELQIAACEVSGIGGC